MRSLKAAFIAGIICCASVSAFAQGAYVKLGGGYNVAIGSQYGHKMVITTTWDESTNLWHSKEKVERVKVNFGKGFTGNVAFGNMFTKQLGAEAEVSYLAGGNNHTSFQRISNPDPDISMHANTNKHARMVLIQPSLIMVTKLSENLRLYGKFGIVTGKGTIFVKEEITSFGEFSNELEYSGGWAFGLQGGLGLDYIISQKYALFSEIKVSNLSYAPNKLIITKQLANGENDLMPGEQREFKLENSYTNISGQQETMLKQPFNFSSAGLNIGLKYNF